MARRSVALAVALVAVPALLFACGGETSGSADAGPGSTSSSGALTGSSSGSSSGGTTGSSSGSGSGSASGSSSGGDEPVDAEPTLDAPSPILCMSQGFGGSSGGEGPDGGPPPCETTVSESCSDGHTYSVDCQCPSASCSCTTTTSNGGSSGGGTVMYSGCPGCTQASGLFALCGFPQ